MSLASAAMSLASSVAGRDFFDLVKAIGMINILLSYLILLVALIYLQYISFFSCSLTNLFILTHTFILAYTQCIVHFIGESKSKQEEDRIVSEEVQYLKKIINGSDNYLFINLLLLTSIHSLKIT